MKVDYGIVYAEVYDILRLMDKSIVMQIPVEILEYIKNERDVNYNSKIDFDDIFNRNNIHPESLNLLAWLDLSYWADKDTRKSLFQAYYQKDEQMHPNVFSFKKNDNN
jgi:hypothetical protein